MTSSRKPATSPSSCSRSTSASWSTCTPEAMYMTTMMKRILLGALALGALAAASAHADSRDLALGSDGTVYQVRADTYGNLFPGGKDTSPANQVVALDVTPPGGATQRQLVPGTSGPDSESLPSVVFADDSQTVFLLWETELNI